MRQLHRLISNGMFAFFLCLSGPVLANDLIIEDFNVELLHNGIAVPVGGNLPYLADTDSLSAKVDIAVSWYCKNYVLFIGCEEAKPDFTARLELHATNTGWDNAIVVKNVISFDGSTDVQYRGEINTNESLSKQYTNIQNVASFNEIIAEARHYGDTLKWRLVINTGALIFVPVVSETDVGATDNNTAEVDPSTLWPLSGIFNIGDITATSVTQVNALAENSGCGTTSGFGSRPNLYMNADAIWQVSISNNWNDVIMSDTLFCASYVMSGASGFRTLDLTVTSNVDIGDVTGTLGGMDVTLSNVVLRSEAGQGFNSDSLVIALPDGLSVHDADIGVIGPSSRGTSDLSLTGYTFSDVNNLDALEVSDSNKYLHSEGLPFSVRYSSLNIDSFGLSGQYDRVHYQHNREYYPGDSRGLNLEGPVSNDRRFSAPTYPVPVASEHFTVNSTGLNIVQISFNPAGTTPTHFPRMLENNNVDATFNIVVENGVLKSKQLLSGVEAINSYAFLMSPDCAACGSNVSPILYALNRLPAAVGLSTDGAVAVSVNGLSNPGWGPAATPGPGLKSFQRSGDDALSGMLYIPGHIAVGTGLTQNAKVTDSLLGSRQFFIDSSTYIPGIHNALGSAHADRGNYFFPGLTVGPETYSSLVSAAVDIGLGQDFAAASSNTQIQLGGHARIGFPDDPQPTSLTVSSSDATKYVVRPAGLTGVFNAASVPAGASVYDYAFNFDRFAFRQVTNVIDSYTWIDGEVDVIGKGGFSVVFESLGLQCSGDLAAGVVAYDDCSDSVDSNGNVRINENCSESLSAWTADIELLSLAFVPENPSPAAMCDAQPRFVQVGNTVTLHALNRPLGMLAKWTSDGEPFDASVSGVTDHVLDRPKGADVPPSEDQGFNIALRSGIELRTPTQGATVNGSDTDGWFKVSGDIGVPFWESLDISARIANSQSIVGEQEQTIINKRNGFLTSSVEDDAFKTNVELANENEMQGLRPSIAQPNADASAIYKWGKTDFGFDMPLYYAKGRATGNEADRKKPMFLGRRVKNVDLIVMDVDRGVNFVSPENTRISFGASANFDLISQLGESIDLHIDFNDPDSVKKVDNFLCTFLTGCSSNAIDRPIGKVFYKLNGELDKLNDVVGSGLDGFLEEGVESALNNATVNPLLTTVSDTLGKMHALPNHLASSVSSVYGELADDLILPLNNDLDALMVNLYLGLPEVLIPAQKGVAISPDLQIFADSLQSAIDALKFAQGAATGIQNRIYGSEGANTLIGNALSDARAEVSASLIALADLINELDNVTSLAGSLTSCNLDMTLPQPSTSGLLGKLAEVHGRISEIEVSLAGFKILSFGKAVAKVAKVDLGAFATASREIENRVEDLTTIFNDVKQGIEGICNPEIVSELGSVTASAQTLLTTLRGKVLAIDIAASNIKTASDATLLGLRDQIGAVTSRISSVSAELERLKTTVTEAQAGRVGEFDWSDFTDDAAGYQAARASLSGIFNSGTGIAIDFHYLPFDSEVESRSFIYALSRTVRQAVDVATAEVIKNAHAELQGLVDTVPQPSVADLRSLLVDLIMNSTAIESIDIEINKQISRLHKPVTDLVVGASDQINFVLQELAQKLESAAKEALDLAGAPVKDLPIKSAGIDGYGLIAGNELERIHIAANWEMSGDADESGSIFGGALDVINQSAVSRGQGCNVDDEDGTLTAIISSKSLPIKLGLSDASIRELELGFSLDTAVFPYTPRGVFGGIALDGTVDFKAFEFYDLAFAAGVGVQENYLGATGAAMFDDYQFNAAFLIGKTCPGSTVLTSLDPDTLIETNNGEFSGVYVRGGASIPIWPSVPPGSCSLRVKVGADMGAWLLTGTPLTYGGLVGGSASGEVACAVSLRGSVLVSGQQVGDKFVFSGEGFGVGGFGWDCDPGTWTSAPRSRKDDYCATGDAQFGAEYNDGWDILKPRVSALH